MKNNNTAEWKKLSEEVDEAKAECAAAQKRIINTKSAPAIDQRIEESHQALKRWYDAMAKLARFICNS